MHATQLGFQTLSLNNIRGCYATFSGRWAPSPPLHMNDTVYEGTQFPNDTSNPATFGVSVTVAPCLRSSTDPMA